MKYSHPAHPKTGYALTTDIMSVPACSHGS